MEREQFGPKLLGREEAVGKVVNTIGIHQINHNPASGVVCFVNTHPLDSYL